MAKLSVTVCDKCRIMDKVTTQYTIEGGGKLAVLDLCAEDAKALVAFQALAVPPEVSPASKAKPRQTGRQSTRVSTMEEIEELKKKGA